MRLFSSLFFKKTESRMLYGNWWRPVAGWRTSDALITNVGDEAVSAEVQATSLMMKNLCTSKRKIQRERERDRLYYRLRRSNMTYETKNISFHVTRVKVSSDSRCSRTLLMNIAIESAHCGCEINSCKDWAQSKRCGKHGRIWSKAEHCIKVWYQKYFISRDTRESE